MVIGDAWHPPPPVHTNQAHELAVYRDEQLDASGATKRKKCLVVDRMAILQCK